MNCLNCQKDIKPIRLNGRLYCPFCGEFVGNDPTYGVDKSTDNTNEYKDTPKAKIIDKEGNEKELESEIRLLEGKEEILDIIEEKASEKKSLQENQNLENSEVDIKDKRIIKSGRRRIDNHDFKIYDNEPDPVATPELTSPHDIKLPPKDQEIRYPLLTNTEKEQHLKKIEQKREVLKEYFSQSAQKISQKPPKQKRLKAKTKKLLYILAGFFVFMLLIIGLTLYVNMFAIKEDYITKRLNNSGIAYKELPYITPGYRLSAESKSDNNFLLVVYEGISDKSKKIFVEIKEVEDYDIYKELAENSGVEYVEKKINDVSIWNIDENIYFLKEGLLYKIYSNSEEGAELEKIATKIIQQ